jgi:hypothetical protein
MSRAQWWRVLLVLTFIGFPLHAQEPGLKDSARNAPDSMRIVSSGVILQNDTLSSPRSRSTILAMGLSAMFPGGGQIYNHSYWKVPVILGLGGYFAYEFIDNHRQYKDYRDQYQASLVTLSSGNDRILRLREFYKEQRDTFGWYFLILYVVNIADAYVDASLFGFDVGDNLGFRGGTPAPTVTIRLWLH